MKIAIIGSGISGLVCGHLLHKNHEIELYEANDYIGGHTATVDIEIEGRTIPIDTGFIVFNDRTYPLFNKLIKSINVPFQNSEMSFSVKNLTNNLEYNGQNLNTLFAQRKNLVSYKFYKLIFEILRFNRLAKLDHNTIQPEQTLGDFLKANGFSNALMYNYLLPMVAAIWSCSMNEALSFPFPFFVRFFKNHGLINVSDRPQWHVIEGGSRSYIPALTKGWSSKIHLSTPVSSVERDNKGVTIHTNAGKKHYDEVIFACHSDQAFGLLANPTTDERNILSKMKYLPNEVTLHQDETMMPKNKKAWASWNFLLEKNTTQEQAPPLVTYYMNRLQGLKNSPDFFVTLNGNKLINPKKILRKFTYHHPLMNFDMIEGQNNRDKICGKNKTHYCGAYWYNGFHEDGVRSAVDVCKRFGVSI
jgi:predicted NAD/FAD-binding protein